MAKHALLSASGSKRWLACPPSVMLEKEFPDSTSEYAKEGTFAHNWAELHLAKYLGHIKQSDFDKKIIRMKENQYYSEDLESYVIDYIDLCIERINAALAADSNSTILLEERLDFSRWVPEGFGTGDLVIISDGLVEIIDLKYGKGVDVSAEDNTQMQLYALGAIDQYSIIYGIDAAMMTICQPRKGGVSSQLKAAKELLTWAEAIVKPTADLAIKGEGIYCAGEHCKFCRAGVECKARAEYNLELLKMEFRNPDLLSDYDIAEVLDKVTALVDWAKTINAYALDQAVNHAKEWPGWKLVEGRSNRKYTDEEVVATTLKNAGYTEDKIYAPREILGISALEKAITKKQFNNLLSDLIIKPTGKPVLVPHSDKREAISSVASAKNDFEIEE